MRRPSRNLGWRPSPRRVELLGRLLRSYAAQGLTQTKVGFTVSLGAACVGFVIIMIGVVTALGGATLTQAGGGGSGRAQAVEPVLAWLKDRYPTT